MAFKLRGSHLIALAIAGAIGGWMYNGNLIMGGQSDAVSPPIAKREADRTSKAFRVRVTTLEPSQRLSRLLIRGRTQAEAMVSVRAETGGTLEQRLVKKGDKVSPGDLLCVIDRGVREMALAQAKAQLTQADADHEANIQLIEKGFATKSKLRVLKSALDAAKSAVANAEWELSRTEIRATTHGTVVTPLAEVGDNLAKGGVCLTLMDADPMLFIGQVSERDIARLSLGQTVGTQLVTGEQVVGKITHIDQVADAKTRTFRVEAAIPNSDGKLRDGVTATSVVQLEPTYAYQLKPSWLTLADDGAIGVRTVKADNSVAFMKIKILSQGNEIMWVEGLEPGTRVITVGQHYVSAGEVVEPVVMQAAAEKSASSTHEGKPATDTAKVTK